MTIVIHRSRLSVLFSAALAVLASCATAQASGSPPDRAAAVRYVDVPTQFVEAKGTRFAYRRLGQKGGFPLVLMQHFRGSMDNWDPALIEALAAERTVIVFDNKGVSGSSGETPDSFTAMADDAADFISTLGYAQVDVLGFSIGGAVAQELAVNHAALVHKLILAGTSMQGGEGMNQRDPKIIAIATRPEPIYDDFLTLFFEPSEHSQALARAFIERRKTRGAIADVPSTLQTMKAQAKARNDWGAGGDAAHTRLAKITQPTLVANGSHDIDVHAELGDDVPRAPGRAADPLSGFGARISLPVPRAVRRERARVPEFLID